MKKLFAFILLLVLSYSATYSQAPNWAEHVAPILYNNCTSCHHSGGLAPFSLMTYADAVANAGMMQGDVNSGKMPPWPPSPHYTRLAHERLLSMADVQTINDWVNGGKVQGNLSLAPTPPTYNSNSQIGIPDLTVQMPTYTSTAASSDIYRCFVMPSNLSVQKFATAVEVIPGNGAIVHHVLVYYDTSSVCIGLDAADPGPGFTSFGGVGSSTAQLVGIWVPGSTPLTFPTGFGMAIPANAKIILQIHYPSGSNGQADSTKVNFKLTSTSLRPLFMTPALNYWSQMTNGPLIIPANQVKTFYEAYTLPLDIALLSVGPHMHLLGQNIKVYGIKTNGDTLPMIDIPHWDFHWQGVYSFRNIMKVPTGTSLRAEATYDNTTNNASNPNSPPQMVVAGEATTDEMMLCYFLYSYYLPGDENIVIDSSPLIDIGTAAPLPAVSMTDFSMYPNPTSRQLMITLNEFKSTDVPFAVYGLDGRLIYKTVLSQKQTNLNIGFLSAGSYVLKCGGSTKMLVKE